MSTKLDFSCSACFSICVCFHSFVVVVVVRCVYLCFGNLIENFSLLLGFSHGVRQRGKKKSQNLNNVHSCVRIIFDVVLFLKVKNAKQT